MGIVVTLEELKTIRTSLRRQKKHVVFTNGVFDIIHRGHIEYLTKSKASGDTLVVGINSDESVRRIKGDQRPVVPQEDRAFVVANLTPVDYVCLFNEDTPLALISAIVPDVLVKGADWSIDKIVGREVVEQAGGKVATIEFVPDRSTTNIIERILQKYSTH
ncbi:MAG: D-glycero-beta-D-manno-heptose 1-phosphate adenylyltransferase [Ignavibacteria bacterium]|nr:D-glycero-beta-D-manno-heptose 1-phosphate adenylyltransferase [Ignavibacteria bacterium]MBI3766532.1 D-glycero-beta-D-manno-heptose 1-phosphate adenylyltransferase [Ignavibacteriales bacterium]